jgi:putative ABC transport system permease protein
MWRWSWLENTVLDVWYGLRMLAKNRGFTAVAALTLALAVGANTAIFSFVDAVILRPLPYPHPEQIVFVRAETPDGGRNPISTVDFLDWKQQNTVFAAIEAEAGGSVTLTGGDLPVQLRGSRESSSYFDVWGVKLMLGRTFSPDEDELGKNQVVVLSHRTWESQFGADPSLIGRTINLDNKPYTVIGVMPPGVFDSTRDVLWIPLAFEPKDMTRDWRWLQCWARLKPGVTLEQAGEQLKAIAARIAHDYPQSNKGWSATVERYVDLRIDDDVRQSLYVLLEAVGAVLLIGCVNLANLLLVRGAGREREVAIRSALGAGRVRLVRQLLTESILLAGLGGTVGVTTGWALMLGLKVWIPSFLFPTETDVQLDGRVLLFTAVLVLFTGVLFGIAPAVYGARADLVGSLKEGGSGATSGVRAKQVRNALAVAEIALAFILLYGAGLLIRSFYQLEQVNPGFDATNVITMQLPMPSKQYPDGPRIINYLEQVTDKIRALPGVRGAATTAALSFDGWGDDMWFQIEGKPLVERAPQPTCGFKRVSPSYLSTLGMRLLKGRWLAETDAPATVPVAVINETMATRYFKGEDPIGKRVLIQQLGRSGWTWLTPGRLLGPETAWQVVGVVADEKVWRLDDSSAGLYVSFKQSPTSQTALVVRGAMDPTRLVKSIQSAVWQVNKNQPLDDVRTLEQIKSESLGENRLRTVLLGVFAGLALLLAAIGIYGVISYSVAQRTHEMAVRAALGASRWDQLRLVLKSGMSLTAIGMAIGVAGALALTRLLASLLFGVSPRDPWTLALAGAVLAAVAAAACYIPAQRATRVDPAVALRHD